MVASRTFVFAVVEEPACAYATDGVGCGPAGLPFRVTSRGQAGEPWISKPGLRPHERGRQNRVDEEGAVCAELLQPVGRCLRSPRRRGRLRSRVASWRPRGRRDLHPFVTEQFELAGAVIVVARAHIILEKPRCIPTSRGEPSSLAYRPTPPGKAGRGGGLVSSRRA